MANLKLIPLLVVSLSYCLLIANANDATLKPIEEQRFNEFLEKFDKRYINDEEKERRFEIFKKNLIKIKVLNKYEQGTATYGITKFADLTISEFRRLHTGLRPDLLGKQDDQVDGYKRIVTNYVDDDPLPQSFDWRQKPGVVSGVKDQGMCGSCWAFSTTGNVEGQSAIVRNKSVSLSEQELVECDSLDQGCDGGLMTNAYKAIIKLGGLESETDYPYEGIFGDKCHANRTLAKVDIDSYVVLPENETQLAQWLSKYGPISIGINAQAMQFYLGGISHPSKWICNPSKLDHGVLIVGFGVGKTRILRKVLPYWVIKNSWGGSWGEKGYYRVLRGEGTCGLNKMATSAWINS